MDFSRGQCRHGLTLKQALGGTTPEGTVSPGFELALSPITWKITAYITVQFLFSQVQLYISRATGKAVKLTIFL